MKPEQQALLDKLSQFVEQTDPEDERMFEKVRKCKSAVKVRSAFERAFENVRTSTYLPVAPGTVHPLA